MLLPTGPNVKWSSTKFCRDWHRKACYLVSSKYLTQQGKKHPEKGAIECSPIITLVFFIHFCLLEELTIHRYQRTFGYIACPSTCRTRNTPPHQLHIAISPPIPHQLPVDLLPLLPCPTILRGRLTRAITWHAAFIGPVLFCCTGFPIFPVSWWGLRFIVFLAVFFLFLKACVSDRTWGIWHQPLFVWTTHRAIVLINSFPFYTSKILSSKCKMFVKA